MLAALLSSALTLAPAASATDVRVQSIAGARLVAVAEQKVAARLGPPYTHVSVRVIGRPGRITLPPGPVHLEAGAIVGPWPRARVSVPVRIIVAGRCVQTAAVWFAVKAFETVETYAAAATRGTPAAALTLQRVSVDVASIGAPLMDGSALKGLRLHQAVQAGQPVTRGDFESIPDVDVQQRVRVRVTYGAIHIDAVGTALAAGMKGTTVPVVLTDGHEPFRAEITGKGVVDLEH